MTAIGRGGDAAAARCYSLSEVIQATVVVGQPSTIRWCGPHSRTSMAGPEAAATVAEAEGGDG